MSTFRKYDHLERLGHSRTQDILIGTTYVFPKLDGTNASAWHDEEHGVQCGSRNRHLTLDQDNAGFYHWATGEDGSAEALRAACERNPNWILYGEWLVPHTLKSYREDAWGRFWVFDVYDREEERYLAFDEYAHLSLAGVDVVDPLCTIEDPTPEQVMAQVETNTFLIQDGAGLGEGVVVKNYGWRSPRGGQPWAKVVRNEFKDRARKAHGHCEKQGAYQVEKAIAEQFCTAALVGKTRAKVVVDVANKHGIRTMLVEEHAGPGGARFEHVTPDPNFQQRVEEDHRAEVIPQLLGRVYHDLVTEEIWAILKEHRDPKIDFKLLRGQVTRQVKEYAQDLF